MTRFATAGLLVAATLVAGYGRPKVLKRVTIPGLSESSGLVASRQQPGVLWSHNDSGHKPVLFGFTNAGKHLGTWTVPGAQMIDWEALALGPGPKPGRQYLYIGDIGDNLGRRKVVTVYRVPEPNTEARTRRTERAEALRFAYPDGTHDAEAMLVHPDTGDLYLITKGRGLDPQTHVFKAAAPLRRDTIQQLTLVGELPLRGSLMALLVGLVTDASISPDGRRVALCGYSEGWEARVREGDTSFDEIWKGPWQAFDPGDRDQGETITYSGDGTALLLSSEGTAFDLIRITPE